MPTIDQRRARRREATETLISLVFLGIVAFGLVVFGPLMAASASGGMALRVGGLAIFYVVAHLAFTYRGLIAPDAETLLARDTRPPILYLRSFSADNSRQAPAARAPIYVPQAPDEFRIFQLLRDLGPVVAVGMPGEIAPPAGGSRLYVPDGEWEERVVDLIQRAQLVIARAGTTPGLLWEIKACVQFARPDRFLLFLPYGASTKGSSEEYARFKEQADRLLPTRLPNWIPGHLFMVFDELWTPYFVEPQGAAPARRDGDTYLLVHFAWALGRLGYRGGDIIRRYRRRAEWAGCIFWILWLIAFIVIMAMIE